MTDIVGSAGGGGGVGELFFELEGLENSQDAVVCGEAVGFGWPAKVDVLADVGRDVKIKAGDLVEGGAEQRVGDGGAGVVWVGAGGDEGIPEVVDDLGHDVARGGGVFACWWEGFFLGGAVIREEEKRDDNDGDEEG